MVRLWGKSPLKQDSFIHSLISMHRISALCQVYCTPVLENGATGVNKMDMVLCVTGETDNKQETKKTMERISLRECYEEKSGRGRRMEPTLKVGKLGKISLRK